LETITSDRAESLSQIRHDLARLQVEDDWVIWGRWLLGDRSARTVSPFSRMTTSEYIENKVKANTPKSLAELQRFASGDPERSRRVSRARDKLPPAFAPTQQAGTLLAKGNAQARAGQWTNAIATFSKLAELEPDNYENCHSLAALLVQNGDEEAYHRHCAGLLARFGTTQDPVTAERLAKDCLILPFPGDVSAVANLAETAVRLGSNHTFFIYFQFAKGLAEYRQGAFARAAQWMETVLSAGGAPTRQAEAQFVLAMAYHRLNHTDAARAAFSSGLEIVQKTLPKLESGDIGAGWIDWIIARALMREAKSLIEGPLEANRSPK
jgi:tetratricopeptide (TPR) repeat protein